MKTFEVEIPEEVCNYLESLMYETNARKNLLAFCIEHDLNEKDAFNDYHKEYIEFSAQYEMAKEEMASKYIYPKYPSCTWNLNFNTKIAIVEVQ